MTNKPLLLAALLLTACAAMTSPGGGSGGKPHPIQFQDPSVRRASYCHLHTCDVTVTVDANCHVTVDPYVLVIGGASPPFTIRWKLDGNASFARDGVWFKEAEGQNVFRLLEGHERSYIFQDLGKAGIYHYGVQVEQGGKACPILDPTGVNDI